MISLVSFESTFQFILLDLNCLDLFSHFFCDEFSPTRHVVSRSLHLTLFFFLGSHSLKLAPQLAGNGLYLQPFSSYFLQITKRFQLIFNRKCCISALQLALLQQGSGSGVGGLANSLQNGTGSQPSLHDLHGISGSLEDLKSTTQRRSQNMTECVPVPSSEHVAEIVGRQGKKPLKSVKIKNMNFPPNSTPIVPLIAFNLKENVLFLKNKLKIRRLMSKI